MIHFHKELVFKTMEIIKDAHDCADILHDLNRIEQAVVNVDSYVGLFTANQLDQELRQKYPGINAMLKFANAMLPSSPQIDKIAPVNETTKSNLTQDYYGILFDTAMKKELIHCAKEFIKSVD